MARIRNVSRSAAQVYLLRARQYRKQLDRAQSDREWEAVGLLAVHLAICSADAVTASRSGQVWAGQDHGGSVEVLNQTTVDGARSATEQLRAILEAKTRVEYGADPLTPSRASDLAKRARRLFEWAEEAASQS